VSRKKTRRQVLQDGAVLAALPLLARCTPSPTDPTPTDAGPPVRPTTNPDVDGARDVAFNPSAAPQDTLNFPLPVQAGAAEATAVTFWCYVANGSPVTLRVWRPSTTTGNAMVAHEETLSPVEGYVKLRVTTLAPDTLYSYGFFTALDAARSGLGQVRTAWPPGYRWPLTLAATTCTNWRYRPYTALERTAQEDVDLLCHLGDMTYCDGAMTQNQYRALWRENLADPGYQALLPKAGSCIVWDDHEFTNDFNPERLDQGVMAAARAAFFETTPMEPGPQGQLWRSFRWGDTAEVILLDCRTERLPSTLATPPAQYMSTAQMAFLKQTLQESPCHFKVILNSVPMTNFPDTFWANSNDRWEGYTAAREEILTFLEQNNLDNVWFLSGDFHLGFVARLETSGFRRQLFDVAVGPGGNQGNPLPGLAMGSAELAEEIFPADQFLYWRGNIAMTLLTFDPLRDEVRIRFVDAATNETLFDQVVSRRS